MISCGQGEDRWTERFSSSANVFQFVSLRLKCLFMIHKIQDGSVKYYLVHRPSSDVGVGTFSCDRWHM